MRKGCKIIHKDCDPSLSQDRSLPYTAFMVEYVEGETTKFDIVSAGKLVEVFDDYWDKYHSVISMKQTEGRANPKLWQNPNKKSK